MAAVAEPTSLVHLDSKVDGELPLVELLERLHPGTETGAGAEASAECASTGEDIEVCVVDPLEIANGDDPGEVDLKSGVPKVLKAYSVGEEDGPRLSVVPHFLGEEEIQHLLSLAERSWTPSEVGTGVYRSADESKDLNNAQSNRRTSFSCMLEPFQTRTVTSIELRLARLAGIDVDYLEPLNMVRYAPGQFFKTHHDGRFRPKTIFIYLNDLPEDDGGETFFPELQLQVVPRRGCAVMWTNISGPQQDDQRMVHQGLPPKTAVKYGVNCFFNDKKMKSYRLVGTQAPSPAVSSGRWRTIDAAALAQAGQTPLEAGQVRRLQAVSSPPVWFAPTLLTTEEAKMLVQLADAGMHLERATDRELIANLQLRASALAGQSTECLGRVEVSKLGNSAEADGSHLLSPEAYREKFGTVTVFLFLNTSEEGGGEFRFPQLGLQFLPSPCCAIAWAGPAAAEGPGPHAVHQAMPPKAGCRYGVFCKFYGVAAL